MNDRDKEALRAHVLAIRERTDQILRILNKERNPRPGTSPQPVRNPNDGNIETPIPDGAWRGDPASQRQIDTLLKAKIEVWDQITKGEASILIEDLFKRRKKK